MGPNARTLISTPPRPRVHSPLSPTPLTGFWAAAASSAASFTAGALLPLVAILLPPASLRVPVAFTAVVIGLLLTGWVSASLGEAPKRRAIARLIIGGAIAMAVTFAIGYAFGTVTS